MLVSAMVPVFHQETLSELDPHEAQSRISSSKGSLQPVINDTRNIKVECFAIDKRIADYLVKFNKNG
ncbi:hypothetical protein MCEMIH22_01883 [Candidatus Methylacidiphilaceae bacterium]